MGAELDERDTVGPRQGKIGPYTVLKELGSGGMGKVFRGLAPDYELVAVKVIKPEFADQEGYRKRFAREVEAARLVSSEFTARVLDADPDADLPWLATTYIEGPTLEQQVKEHGTLPPESVLVLARDLATGLSEIHAAGVVHRDLKPANIIMVGAKPVIIDFGIARAIGRTQITEPGSVVGTYGFMSPEQESGSGIGKVGPASDVYSLGMTLRYAATGEAPLTPQLEGVPELLGPLFSACVAESPGDRPTPLAIIANPRRPVLPQPAPVTVTTSAPLPRPDENPGIERHGNGFASMANGPRNGLLYKVMTRPSGPLPAPPSSWRERFKSSLEFRIRAILAGVLIVAICALPTVITMRVAQERWDYWRAPVFRPAGLTAAYAGPDMVGFTWAPPASGPQPDSYEVLEDGQLVHRVASSQTSYIVQGNLTPGTSHAFQVIAIRDGKSSKVSADLSMAPGLPASTTLNWSGTVTDKATSVQPPDPSYMATGQNFADDWTFTDNCSAGDCQTALSGAIDGTSFTDTLTSSGSVYTGDTTMDYGYCDTPKDPAVYDVHVQARIQNAQQQGGSWVAYTWTGTVTMTPSATSNCGVDAMTLAVNS